MRSVEVGQTVDFPTRIIYRLLRPVIEVEPETRWKASQGGKLSGPSEWAETFRLQSRCAESKSPQAEILSEAPGRI
jgi:hypothetical protein